MLTHFSKSIFVKNKSTQHGVSLVELLIAMTLGLVLLAGMLTVFAGNKQSSELNTALAQIQENARFALSRMSRDMRMAGYQGCLDPNQGTINVVSLESTPDNQQPLAHLLRQMEAGILLFQVAFYLQQ